MINNKKVLAIIPARGGSKRLPRKNILPLAGKPLIAWTIEAALDSQIFDEVIVNTDDQEIAGIARDFGVDVPFIRPESLATDTSSSIALTKHTLLWFKERGITYTHVVLLQPTSPLRNGKMIKDAWKVFCEGDTDSVTSVCEVEHPIQWTYALSDRDVLTPLFENTDERSQDYEKNYRVNGAIYITATNFLLSQDDFISSENGNAYIMSSKHSVDIDNEIDFKFAELLINE